MLSSWGTEINETEPCLQGIYNLSSFDQSDVSIVSWQIK